MSTLDDIAKERQLLAERLAKLDGDRAKLAEQLAELEAAERVLSRFTQAKPRAGRRGRRAAAAATAAAAEPRRGRRGQRPPRQRRPRIPQRQRQATHQGRRAKGGEGDSTAARAGGVSLGDATLRAVAAHGNGISAEDVRKYIADQLGMQVRPNHLGMALQRHRRAGRLEQRDLCGSRANRPRPKPRRRRQRPVALVDALLREYGAEAQPDVIGDPGAGLVHQHRPQQIGDLGARVRAVGLRQRRRKNPRRRCRATPRDRSARPSAAERCAIPSTVNPALRASADRPRPTGKYHGLRRCASSPRRAEHRGQRDDDRRGIVVAAHLARQTGRPVSAPGGPRRAPPPAGASNAARHSRTPRRTRRSKARLWPGMTRASMPRARAAATMSGAASTATTSAPAATIFSVNAPSPQPRSRMRSPARGGEQFEDRGAERGHEMRRLGIALGLPVLPRDLRHAHGFAPRPAARPGGAAPTASCAS